MEFDSRVHTGHGTPMHFGMDAVFAQSSTIDQGSMQLPLGVPDQQSLDPRQSYYHSLPETSLARWDLFDEQENDGQVEGIGSLSVHTTDSQRRSRACEGCRGLKVRCDFPPDAEKCRRCAKARRQCIVTVPSRKRQRKTDSKVADLEKRIDDLTATLEAQKKQMRSGQADGRSAASGISAQQHAFSEMSLMHTTEHVSKKRKASSTSGGASPLSGPIYSKDELQHQLMAMPGPPPSADMARVRNEYADVIDRGYITSEQASRAFEHYKANMEKHLPCVVFSPETTHGMIRKTKPVLFLAVLSVASSQEYPELQRVMTREAMKTIADRVVCRGEKSLELIQAMQVLTIWHTPEDPRDTMTYQLIHMASSMAIGLDLNHPASQPSIGRATDDRSQPVVADAIEKKRTWLSCFLLCGICSLPMRQQNTVRWSPFLNDIVSLLRARPSIPSDRTLCRWIDIQCISDRSTDIASVLANGEIKKEAVRKELKSMVERLDEIKKEVDEVEAVSLYLEIFEAEVHVKMVAMRVEEENTSPAPSNSKTQQPTKLSPIHAAAITKCQTCIHTLLDTFASFLSRATTIELNALPSFHFARVAYCLIALICLHFSSSSPLSNLRSVISKSDFRVSDHLDKLLALLRSSASDEVRRPAQKFQLLINMLKAWFERRGGSKSISANAADCPSSRVSHSFQLNSNSFQNKPKSTSALTDASTPSSLRIQPPTPSDERHTPRMGYRKLHVGMGFDGEDEEGWAVMPPASNLSTTPSRASQQFLDEVSVRAQRSLSHPMTVTQQMSGGRTGSVPETVSRVTAAYGSIPTVSGLAPTSSVSKDEPPYPLRTSPSPVNMLAQPNTTIPSNLAAPQPSADFARSASWAHPSAEHGWYDHANTNFGQHQHQQQHQPYAGDPPLQTLQNYAPNETEWAPAADSSGAVPMGTAGVLDPGIEQAMGMAFGVEGQMFGSFMDDFVAGVQGGSAEEFGWLG